MSKLQLTVYVPRSKEDRKYPQRLARLAMKRERSTSFLLLEAIDQYLQKEEKGGRDEKV